MKQSNHRWVAIAGLSSIAAAAYFLFAWSLPTYGSTNRQDGPASDYTGPPQNVFTELVLDQELDAVLNVQLFMSPILVDPRSRKACRVASILNYTMLGGRLQADLVHMAPLLDPDGKDPIMSDTSYDMRSLDPTGKSGGRVDYTILYAPKEGLSWKDVTGIDQLAVTANLLRKQ